MEETNQQQTPQPTVQNTAPPPPLQPATPEIPVPQSTVGQTMLAPEVSDEQQTEQTTPPQTPKTPSMSRLKVFLIFIGFILVFVGIFSYLLSTKGNFSNNKPKVSPTPSERACTLEAKVCPDGTSVGRTGPNCEFAPCPSAKPNQDANIQNESSQSAIIDREATQSGALCKNVDLNPKELTFEAYYCNGSLCSSAKTKTDCEARDVVKIVNGKIVSGTDGQFDCQWVNNSCQPNK